MKLLSGICCLSLLFFISCATLKPASDDSVEEIQIAPIQSEETLETQAPVFEELPETAEQIPADIPIPEIAVADEAFLEPPLTKTDTFVLAEPDIRTLPEAAMPVIPPDPPPSTESAIVAVPQTVITPQPVPDQVEIKPDTVAEEKTPGDPVLDEEEVPPEPEGGIWLAEEERPYIASYSEPLPIVNPVPSRKSEADLNQFIDIDYPGVGWIYLGENRSDPLLSFSGRKLTETGTQFVLRSKKPGTTVLHFYKQDLLKNAYIDDFIEVTVSDKVQTGIDRTGIPGLPSVITKKTETAPVPSVDNAVSIADITEPAAAEQDPQSPVASQDIPSLPVPTQTALTDSPQTATVIQTDESSPVRTAAPPPSPATRAPNNTVAPDLSQTAQVTQTAQTAAPTVTRTPNPVTEDFSALSAETLLQRAKEAVTTAPAQALALLDVFFTKAVTDLDQGYLLRGQAYETRGPSQNIRSALESYQQLMNLYPASPYWKQASERVTYLNRFYFNIR